jgi:hypothetical protein
MDFNYLNELVTTSNQIVVIILYALIVGLLLWRVKKEPRVSSAFVWYLLFRHIITFTALLFCSFLIFASTSLFFIALTCIDVRNFYREPSKIKSSGYKLPIIKIRVSTKPVFQLFIFFLLDITAWFIIMTISDLFPSGIVWYRLHF